jgi:pilus assembly protein Flp/PilA
MRISIQRLRAQEEGATAVEYGIMVALIAIVIIAAVFALGGTLSDNFQNVADCLENPGPDAPEDCEAPLESD